MKCKNCGAEIHGNICEYCKSEIPKKTSSINITNNYYNTKRLHDIPYRKQKPKKKTWLWTLGWIFIFPVPLTILLLRKKDMQPTIRYGLISFIWIFIFIISFWGENNNKTYSKSPDIPATIEKTINKQEKEQNPNKDNADKKEDASEESKANSNKISTEKNVEIIYAKDKVVNKFISEFNEKSASKITNISKGNIRTKYFGNVNGCYLEMLNATENNAKIFSLDIMGSANTNDNQSIFEVFKTAVQILDPSIQNNIIDETFLTFNDKFIGNKKIGDTISVDYVPAGIHLNKSQIRISASNFR